MVGTSGIESKPYSQKPGVVVTVMELALDEEGAQVTAVTSYDSSFPPVNILDG